MASEQVWLNEPPRWSVDGETITMHTGARTDFWCRTMQDILSAEDWAARALEPPLYVVDNGHFLYETVSGDFTASGFASGDYNAQYDQVGLFLRDDADNWLKASVEVIYGSWSPDYHLSNPAHVFGVTLTTNGWSAWAPLPESPANPPGVWVRVHRQGSTYLVDYSEDGERFDLVNMFSMPGVDEIMVGVYATSPTGFGFDARIDHYSLVRNGT